MRFTTEQRLADGVLERGFTLGEIPGVLWTPESSAAPAPLILLGHPGGLRSMRPRLEARARHAAAQGFAAVTVELPVVDRLVLPLVDQAVPEWRAVLDAVLPLPGIGDRVGYAGGVIAVGVRLAVVEPRISAALLFAGSFVPRATFQEARRVAIPLQVLLQWDDEGNDRQMALDLFDALGSAEKTLHANTGGHTGIPQFEGDDGNRFFARHLR